MYEKWASARELLESDEKITFGAIGASLGISKQAVAKKAKNDRWQKGETISTIVRRAHERADITSVNHTLPEVFWARGKEAKAPQVEDCRGKKIQPPEALADRVDLEESETSVALREESTAVAKRAEVLARHRQESNAVRSIAYDAIRAKDGAMAKVSKINAETLQVIQAMERKSWGLDRAESSGTQVIVIDRGNGPLPFLQSAIP